MAEPLGALVLLGHGSRLDSSNQGLAEVARRLAAQLPVERVEVAFLQLARPDLTEAVARCVAAGARRVGIVPFFLFPGAHVLEDIPRAVDALRERFPGVTFVLAPAIGDHPKVVEAAADRAREILS